MSAIPPFASFPVLPLPPGLHENIPEVNAKMVFRRDPAAYAAIKPVAALTVPDQIATFSYDENHVLRHDDSSLRYFVDPPVGANLDAGYENWPRRDDEHYRLDALLETYARAVDSGKVKEKPNVVTWRGMMTKIMTAQYEDRDEWEMNAMILDGTLYLEDNKGVTYLNPHTLKSREPLELTPKRTVTEPQRKLMYTGYAFESYCTVDHPSQEPIVGSHEPDVNTNMQWCSVVQTNLGPWNLVLGGEVDCVRGRYTGKNDGNYVELKTSAVVRSDRDGKNFERSALKYWAQSYLLGIPEVVVGFRSPQEPYHLEATQTFETFQLPRLGLKAGWSASACLNWTNAVIEYIHQRCKAESPRDPLDGKLFRVMYRPRFGLQVWVLGLPSIPSIQDVDPGVQRIGFLPKQYWDWMQNRMNARPV
ncbi:RAI1-domain-containing protein [Calocera cornea HHB12733]|uniref:Decapping nuclease n=1 Tax=Calocera cornea HHB12733 TaxID=1353952 RepID=A0A165CDC6_9BASI|nr:RAI1-domain-containing protein [Calocera cornea HHB12733]